MKRIFLIAISILMCVSFAACSGKGTDNLPSENLPPSEITSPSEGETPDLPSDEPGDPDYIIPPENIPGEEPPATTEPNEPVKPETPEPSEPVKPEVPAIKIDTLLSSTVNALNVRSGAGTKYATKGTLDKSDMVMPVRKTGSWYEVQYMNSVGYVSASYVKSVTFTASTDKIEKVISAGKKLLGIPYVFGATRYHWGNGTLNTAFTGRSYDCSSLMQYIFKVGANVNLAMTSREQSLQGSAVKKANIKRGDLLFFTNATRYNNKGVERIGHVALYLGDNIILHTASDHAVIEPISSQRWSYYITARRVI